jgi:hypothetical protein
MIEKFRKILPKLKNVKVIEAIIDPEIHLEYIDLSSKIKDEDRNQKKIIAESDLIFSKETDIETKKRLLTIMAKIDDISIYRKIEKYLENPDPELADWAKIAQQESLMVIQSSLLDEEQVLISTGLGGKGSKWRFFIIIRNKNDENFKEFEKEALKNEIKFTFKEFDIELEKIQFGNFFLTMTALFPLDFDVIENSLKKIFHESKNIGINLSDKYIVTNVKTIPIEECEELFKELEERIKENTKDAEDFDDFPDIDDDFDDDFDDEEDDIY